MTVHKERFAELVNKLVNHIALRKGGKQKYEVTEIELADHLSVSQSTLQTWRQGKHMPAEPDLIGAELVKFGVTVWGMDRQWADALLLNTGCPKRKELMAQLFANTSFPAKAEVNRTKTSIEHLESPESPVPLDSPFYIERLSDQKALQAITHQGVTMTIKGPAKMGKTSLLYRVRAAAESLGKQTICVNFREFDTESLSDATHFFRQFCQYISDELELNVQIDDIWSSASTNPALCRRFIIRHVLNQLDRPLVLALENVDEIFGAPFRSDFFSMLRSWHDDSQYRPVWRKLDRVLITSTEPYQFIEDINKSPFNVGEVVELDDFVLEQVSDLNRRHQSPFAPEETHKLMQLLNGHPYLVRRALYLVLQRFLSTNDLFDKATSDDGPFREHLTALLADLMHSNPELRLALQDVIANNRAPESHIFFRLRGAGLVRRSGQSIYPRCQLYADFFQERLNG